MSDNQSSTTPDKPFIANEGRIVEKQLPLFINEAITHRIGLKFVTLTL